MDQHSMASIYSAVEVASLTNIECRNNTRELVDPEAFCIKLTKAFNASVILRQEAKNFLKLRD